MRLSGKVAAVTGGGGGLGSAIVQGLRDDGAVVYSLDRQHGQGSPTVPDLRLDVDVTHEEDLARAFREIENRHGCLDALIVAAGIQLHGQDAKAAEVSLQVWQKTIDVNLTGAFLTVKGGLPLLVKSGSGSLVLIGSPTGMTMSGSGYTAYGASKAGMMGLSRIIAADYASEGVRSNVVVPGTMETPLITALLEQPGAREQFIAGTPIGRLGNPADIVGIVNWLASDESGFATGALFAVDGGLTAR
jgi:NAD(P)-dependent dehydrogenase (short-subunit alcohol dehydrogenase family)